MRVQGNPESINPLENEQRMNRRNTGIRKRKRMYSVPLSTENMPAATIARLISTLPDNRVEGK